MVVSGRTEYEVVIGADVAEDRSTVSMLLEGAKKRLASPNVEVGVFGSIKRGKSTLVNALVGAEVSSMRVTPETAIPVVIQSGAPQVSVLLADGQLLEDLDPAKAIEMGSQRYKARDLSRKPQRVFVTKRINWLPEGVRFIDTPGLNDPSLAEDYEKLTMAELDRVAAAVLVLLSPPGPEGDEVRLLRSLGKHGVDRVFLVCNFYPDHWNDEEKRDEMLAYIESLVCEGAEGGVDSGDVRLFAVSAKEGFKAVVDGDDEAFVRSGVAAVRDSLSAYLTDGILDHMLGFVERRLTMSTQVITDVLQQRRGILMNPSVLFDMESQLRNELNTSRQLLSQMENSLRESSAQTVQRLTACLKAPFINAIDTAERARSQYDVERLSQQLRLQVETAVSEASMIFAQHASLQQSRLHRQLFDSFGISDRLRTDTTSVEMGSLVEGFTPTMPTTTTDWDTVALGSAAGAAGLGLLGATLAGGAGIALIASGPIGWLIGLGIGAVVGGGAGALLTKQATADDLSAQNRSTLVAELKAKATSIPSNVNDRVMLWQESTMAELSLLRSTYFGEREDELAHIQRLAGDESGRRHHLAEIDRLLAELDTIKV